ncbi:MAG: reductive dehalogenase [Candidatus Aminicenantes bacterium]|nr:reductive dehalogenase [Candidatus Aminicenantes bacterium]
MTITFFWIIAGELVFLCLTGFLFIFCITSLAEKEYRAFRRSGLIFIFLIAVNVLVYLSGEPVRTVVFAGMFFVFMIGILLFFLSPKPKSSISIRSEIKKIDQRDIIFARFELEKGTEKYNNYYKRFPERKAGDDKIRKRPDILTPDHIRKDPYLFNLAAAEFDFLEQQLTLVDGDKATKKTPVTAEDFTKYVKKVLKYLGAVDSGVCLLDQKYIYSHVGRGPEEYGSRIVNQHKYAVVFVIEKDFGMISCAPEAPVVVETAKCYLEIAHIGIVCAGLIRRLGYNARAHIAGSNYQAMVTPMAWKAGLGELGRVGILVHPRLGPRIRLGLITTDIPLVPTGPRVWGIQDFCERCRKCALNCPGRAIPENGKAVENGVEKWVIEREKCYYYWRKVGTDCSTCILTCPFSKPDNFFHGIIRWMALSSRWIQPLLVKGDDFFYGKHPIRKKSPL